jgi:hypothetical protein
VGHIANGLSSFVIARSVSEEAIQGGGSDWIASLCWQ